MGMFGTKINMFNCTSCTEPHLTQEEIDALPKSIKIHVAKLKCKIYLQIQ